MSIQARLYTFNQSFKIIAVYNLGNRHNRITLFIVLFLVVGKDMLQVGIEESTCRVRQTFNVLAAFHTANDNPIIIFDHFFNVRELDRFDGIINV